LTTTLHEMTAVELRNVLRSRKASAREVIEDLFDWIERREPDIGAYLALDRERALARADEIDSLPPSERESAGALAGVPVALKDNICTTDFPTTCASRILQNFVPPYDAHVVERLRREGAIIIGKTNMDEFAMGSSTENSAFHPTRNPWDLERIPGGSSGGSAAAVAADTATLALGSDTGGSIRQPAALCGVVGFKPTYGRVSRYGLVAFASSLDQIGPIAKDVSDAALMMEVIGGHDSRDSTSVTMPAEPYLRDLDRPLDALRVGVPREYFGEGLDAEVGAAVMNAIRALSRIGAEVREISLPHTEYALSTYYIIAPAEASSNLARYDGVHYGYRAANCDDIVTLFARSRAEGFGDEVKRRILLGTYALSAGYYDAYYLKAARVRRLVKNDFDEAFRQVDCIVCPTSPVPAFRLGERTAHPLEMYLTDVFTIPANLAGIPAISLPCGLTRSGLPIGVQIIAQALDDARLLRVARALEREMSWRPTHRPPLPQQAQEGRRRSATSEPASRGPCNGRSLQR